MLEDTQAPVLLTQARLIEDRGSKMENRDPLSSILNPRIKVVRLDRDWGETAHESEKNLENVATVNNLAYVIYTSGSTGRPKAVMISHAAICNHMCWMQTEFPLTETDRVVQKTAYSFDVSVAELFAPLLAGARLIVAQPGKHQDSSYLINLMAQEKVTVLHAVPSLLRVLVEEKEIERCTCLNHVFCGGEVLAADLQKRFFDRFTANLQNLCGPTETCVESTFWTCRRDLDQRTVPIGRPIANTQIYLLDRHKQPVPVGVTGELYIGGAGLARGYLNRPEMTAEKFLPDPFTTEPGARLYRTGDLGRYLPNGNIEFLGRIDHQVKIRGFRIELGEIEAVLAEHPTVRESVVIAREDSAGDKRIVAYFIPHEGAPAISELRGYLKRSLPEYMVPSAWVILESFPLTPNGKVDRKALPVPDFSRTTLEQGYVAPRDSVEGIIAMIWSEVLRRGPIGRHDNFFDLGGHSLKATQIVSRLRKVFQSEIPLRHLFEFPTIAALGVAIDANKPKELSNDKLDGLLKTVSEDQTRKLLFEKGMRKIVWDRHE